MRCAFRRRQQLRDSHLIHKLLLLKFYSEEFMSQGFTLWFTGLSGAGKSTLTLALLPELHQRGLKIEVLDGDEVRTNLSKGLGFSKEDRDTNIRRIGYVARLLSRNGVGVISAAISPYAEVRDEIRQQVTNDGAAFVEVYVKASLDTLVARDVKGLYQKALAGEIKNFTGVSDPYEPPVNPELVIETDSEAIEISVNRVLTKLEELKLIPLSRKAEAA
jgi:adenylyl-sulfate kinase